MSKISDFFALVTVTSSSVWQKVEDVDGNGLEDLFDQDEHLMLCNKHASVVVQFSFDGENVNGGELDPADPTGAPAFDGRRCKKGLWLKLKTGSTAATVAVYGWAR